MIVLFTDFGLADPYVGQLHGVLAREAPGVPVIDLFHGVPSFDIRAGAYLLPAYVSEFAAGSIFLCVIDPGVGTARRPVLLEADGRWYVGPDNGLFHILARRSGRCRCHAIVWNPPRLSASFHGRDLFAPVAAMLARGEQPAVETTTLSTPPGAPWPDDLRQALHVDHYGNVITGVRASVVPPGHCIVIGTCKLPYARVFGECAAGVPFWYENANGLVELSVNRGRADVLLDVGPGTPFSITAP